jgi:hypothetical protein
MAHFSKTLFLSFFLFYCQNTKSERVYVPENQQSRAEIDGSVRFFYPVQIQSVTSESSIWNGNSWNPVVPDCNRHAIIAGDYLGAGFTCKNLTVQAGKKLWAEGSVDVCGNASVLSILISGQINLTGNSIQTIEGNFNDLSLNNPIGVIVSNPVTIFGTLTLLNGSLNTSNQLTLKSTVAKTARLAKVPEGASLIGQITMERYVPGGTAGWYFLGTPIRNQVQANWGDDFLLQPAFIYKHEEGNPAANGWLQASDSLLPGKGFRVYLNQPFFNGGATFRNTGAPVIGDFNFNVSYTTAGFGGGGWNLLANPYPCEIDWHALNRVNMAEQVHFWNGSKYGTYNAAVQVGVNEAGRYIPSSQGFFVKATAESPILSISEAAKPSQPQNPGFYRTAVDVSNEVARFKIHGNDNTSDEAAIRWMPNAQPYFEDQFDSDKISNPELNIYTRSSEGRRTSIQARNFLMADSVDIGYSVNYSGTYFLELNLGQSLLVGKTWQIRDNESGFSYPVGGELFFPFYVEEGFLESPMRFTLIGRKPALATDLLQPGTRLFLYPNPIKEQFQIYGLKAEVDYKIAALDGRIVSEGVTSGKISFHGQPAGLYQLRITGENGLTETLRMVVMP